VEKEPALLLRLENALAWDTFVLVSLMLGVVALVYRSLLRDLSQERHDLVRHQLRSCFQFALVSALLMAAFRLSVKFFPKELQSDARTFLAFVGLMALLVCFLWVVKLIRLCTYIVSFTLSPKVPVPLLLMNVFTFLIAVGFGLLVANEVLGWSVAPLLATSAVLSLVLGLALQDTLGNLLTGIALQVDKPFRIGDWIELQGSGLKAVGQVKEISWRATVLQAFSDEMLVIPNRVVAQSQISNYSSRKHPVLKSHTFRFPFETDWKKIRAALLEEVGALPGIHKTPAPSFLLIENGDSWITCRLLYWIIDFGDSFIVGDNVLLHCHERLLKLGIPLAKPTYEIVARGSTADETPSSR
jgi:small-conductance mechanosensitive channel